jgi:phospholipid/cholesterol/gamma-HCH transport system substrate-binding protein
MKSFAERNNLIIGATGVAVIAATVLVALHYDKLPFINQTRSYSAYFAEAGGLRTDAAVQVAGFRVGKVKSIGLDGPRVLVKFTVDKHISVGDRSEAAIKTKSLLGAKILEVTPRGEGHQSGPIPLNRTVSAYQLPDALGDLTATISGLNTGQLSESLKTLAETFSDTPPEVKVAVEGVARFSQTLDERDAQLRKLLENANKATGVLAQRSDQVVGLIADTNTLLIQLKSQSAALERIFRNISAVSEQLKGFIAENRAAMKPALDKLNGVLAIVDNRKAEVQKSIKLLNAYALSLGEALSAGPFFKTYISNILPGQYLQPFVDAAFSDLGLDPNTLLPSQRVDPQTGQPGTPPLPVPFPRTGQGGEPRRTLPDAITGKPGDQLCGLRGLALPGPGCYPYREPPPAPPPGGPPPGPPASVSPAPTPTRVYQPAPGEVPPPGAPSAGGQS